MSVGDYGVTEEEVVKKKVVRIMRIVYGGTIMTSEIDDLKQLLEDTSKNVSVKGEVAELKSKEQKESEKDYEDWENKESESIVENPKTELYREYLKLLLKGNIHSLICVSKAGFGKTHTTINILKEMGEKFVYKSGYTTPLAFYSFLYENKDKTIILDDLTDDIFQNKKMVAMLKSCLYEAGGERFVSYDTTSDKLSVPSKFKFDGKVILLANEVGNNKKENFNALISRCIYFELKYSFEEILEISRRILYTQKLSSDLNHKVLEIIDNNINKVSQFNFRQLEQLIEMVAYDKEKAEKLFKHSFRRDKIMDMVCDLMNSQLSVKQQAEKFTEKCGMSRAKYFRIKRQIKEENEE